MASKLRAKNERFWATYGPSVMSSSPRLGNEVLAIIGPELSCRARESNLRTQSVMSSIPRLGIQVLDISGPELSCQALGLNL